MVSNIMANIVEDMFILCPGYAQVMPRSCPDAPSIMNNNNHLYKRIEAHVRGSNNFYTILLHLCRNKTKGGV